MLARNWNGGGGNSLWWPIRGGSARKGYLFQVSGIWKGRLSLGEVYEKASALIAALAASLAVLKEKRTKKKREILSNKPLRQRCGHGCWLINRTLLDPLASSFFTFLATGGANRLYKVELNILVLLSLTNFYKTRDMFSTLFKIKKMFLLQEWNTFHTRPQDIPLRKWQGEGSPRDEVESWLRVESSFFFPHLWCSSNNHQKTIFTTHGLTFMYSIL